MKGMVIRRLALPLAFIASLIGCATSAQLGPAQLTSAQQKARFDEFQLERPNEVFVAELPPKTREALRAFESRAALPGGLHYGDSVRDYSIARKSAATIRAEMQQRHCAFKNDVLKDPRTHQPSLVEGKSVPLWVFLCPDGGVVRIKPEGDPTSRYRPQPHGSKALRYPYNSKFEDFSDEVLKVDPEGNAIPKFPAELAPKALVDGWAEDAHQDLGSN